MINQCKKLFALIFIILTSGCSTQAHIEKVTDERLIIKGSPDTFIRAFNIAQRECQKKGMNAVYASESSIDLDTVAFDCVNPEGAANEAPADAGEKTKEAPVE